MKTELSRDGLKNAETRPNGKITWIQEIMKKMKLGPDFCEMKNTFIILKFFRLR